MEMERIKEMEEAIAIDTEHILKKRISIIIKKYQENKEIHTTILEILRALADSKKGFLVIGYLRSSIITESHAFYFGFYKDELFVEENPDYVVLKLSLLFEGVEEDIKEMETLLRKMFVRIFASEIEEIRRNYMLRVYVECKQIFEKILEENCDKKESEVFFGEYMGENVARIGFV